MRHLAAAAALLALASCKIEPTPREYYTQRDAARVERQDAADEIRARVGTFAQALGRGDRADALEALSPEPLTQVIGADSSSGFTRIGPTGLATALDSLQLPTPATARTPDLAVQVSVRDGMGWFSTHLVLIPVGPPPRQPTRMRASGVFTRDRGQWRLLQLHLSRPWAEPAPPDSAATDSARTDSDSLPPR